MISTTRGSPFSFVRAALPGVNGDPAARRDCRVPVLSQYQAERSLRGTAPKSARHSGVPSGQGIDGEVAATRRCPWVIVPSPQWIEKAPRERKSIPRMTCAPCTSRGWTGMAGRSVSRPPNSMRAVTVPRVLTYGGPESFRAEFTSKGGLPVLTVRTTTRGGT